MRTVTKKSTCKFHDFAICIPMRPNELFFAQWPTNSIKGHFIKSLNGDPLQKSLLSFLQREERMLCNCNRRTCFFKYPLNQGLLPYFGSFLWWKCPLSIFKVMTCSTSQVSRNAICNLNTYFPTCLFDQEKKVVKSFRSIMPEWSNESYVHFCSLDRFNISKKVELAL